MRVILWGVQAVFSFVTLAATYVPLVIVASGVEWEGLNLWVWAIIGVTLFALSTFSVVVRLWWNLRQFLSEEGKLKLERLRLEVDKERYDKEKRESGPI